MNCTVLSFSFESLLRKKPLKKKIAFSITKSKMTLLPSFHGIKALSPGLSVTLGSSYKIQCSRWIPLPSLMTTTTASITTMTTKTYLPSSPPRPSSLVPFPPSSFSFLPWTPLSVKSFNLKSSFSTFLTFPPTATSSLTTSLKRSINFMTKRTYASESDPYNPENFKTPQDKFGASNLLGHGPHSTTSSMDGSDSMKVPVTFNTPFFRISFLLIGSLGLGSYLISHFYSSKKSEFGRSSDLNDFFLTRWIQSWLLDPIQVEESARSKFNSSTSSALNNLIRFEKRESPFRRLSFPHSFDRHSDRNVGVGSQVDLSDLKIKHSWDSEERLGGGDVLSL